MVKPIKYPKLLDGKKGREGFYIKQSGKLFYLCYIRGENGCSHCIPISEDTFKRLENEK